MDVQNKRFLDDDGLGIPSVSILATKDRAVISTRETIFAILFFALITGMAMTATIDHATHACQVTHLKTRYPVSYGDHSADDFVARYGRV